MSDWQIHLDGEAADISLLQSMLAGSPYEIAIDGPFNRLTLPGLPPDAGSETVRSAADQLVEVLNGAARLYYERFGRVGFTSVTILDPDGKRRGYGYVTAHVRDHTFTVFGEGDETLAVWVSQALANPEISRALILYGALEPNWKNLYLVLEVIEDDMGGEAELKASGLLRAKELDSFKHTANSYRAVEREARHATLSREPPANPMPIDKASEFIRELLRAWLNFKDGQSA